MSADNTALLHNAVPRPAATAAGHAMKHLRGDSHECG